MTGLGGSSIILQNNSNDSLALNSDGSFSFQSKLKSGETYSVSVAQSLTNPNITCYVSGANGVIANANVDSISIICPALERVEISSNYSSISRDGELEFSLTEPPSVYSHSVVRDLTPFLLGLLLMNQLQL